MALIWRISFLLISINISSGQAKDNKYNDDAACTTTNDQTWCDVNSTFPKDLGVNNVCVTKNYSVFNELDGSNYARLHLIFRDYKVVKVDDKKKEVTVNLIVLLLWEDERMQAFLTPPRNYIQLPPITAEYPSKIWSPFSGIVFPNIRNRRYLFDPVVAHLGLTSAESVNAMFENVSFSGDFTIVQSMIYWSITISCPFNFTAFPFDKNICPFVLKFLNMDVSMGSSNKSLEGIDKSNISDGFEIEIKQINPPDSSYLDHLYFTNVKLSINIGRQVPKYIYQYYIPCMMIVVASSFSFLIPLSAIPGRVALVVTQFLTLTNLFINQMVSTSA